MEDSTSNTISSHSLENYQIESCTKKYFSCHNRLTEFSNLSTGMVHEIRNSLTSVLITLEHFETLELGKSSQARLKIALAESHHLKTLASGILDYSRLQALKLEWVELNQFTRAILTEMSISSVAKGRQLNFECDSESILAQVDLGQYRQALVQLLTNAIEAIQPGQTVFCTLQQQVSQIRFEIRNVTHSVAPSEIKQWMQPFYSTKENGAGLGLMLAKRCIEAHGGKLEINSDRPQVICVALLIPLQEETSPFTARQLTSNVAQSSCHASVLPSSNQTQKLVNAT